MEARLIFNPNARGINSITPEVIKEALLAAGYHPVYQATNCEDDLNDILEGDLEGLIVVAGGDGTLRAVATRIIGQKNVALAVVPLGSANNIAHTLDIDGDPLEIVEGLQNPHKTGFDVGHVSGPWGDEYFLEGLGWGFFADTLAEYDPNEEMSILRSISSALKTWADYEPYRCQMLLDGEDISGDYLLVEILNTITVGPHLGFAPEASPRDGLFNVVRIKENSRVHFFDYLSSLVQGELHELPSVATAQGYELKLQWSGFPIHVDAKICPHTCSHDQGKNKNRDEQTVTIKIMPEALEFWLPANEEKES